ncbi:hypothetical protein ACFQ9X_18040 [Catenulispora yoronensis]
MAVVAGYAGLLVVSFAGGPIPPNALLPVPGVPSQKAPTPASTSAVANGADGVRTSGKPGAADHSAGRPTGATERRPETHASTPGKAGQTSASAPQPTSSGSAAPPQPTPTSAPVSTAASSPTSAHGNPTPPGHQHKSSSAPTG